MKPRQPIAISISALWSAWWESHWLPIAGLSVVVWATFAQLAGNGLVFDDLDAIKNNTTIRSLKNLPILFSRGYFRLSDEYSYRPIVTSSYFLDHAVAGEKPAVYHLHNILLHHANVLLIFALFVLLGVGRWRSFAIALIFALHPLHTEAVIFPGFREDLQMTAGMLAMSCCLAADREHPAATWVLWAPVALAYALFAKEGALVLPVAWVAFDWLYRRRTQREVTLGRRYVLIVFVLLLYVAIRFVVMTNPEAAELDVIDRLPLKQRLITAPYLFAYYVRRFIWPPPLCITPTIEPLRTIGPVFCLSVLVAAAFVALWLELARREPWLLLAGLWVGAVFVPVANVYQIVNLWAERFYYSVGVGTSAIAVAGVGALCNYFGQRMANTRRLALTIGVWIAVGFVVWVAAIYDLRRIRECRTTLSLWRATVRSAPTSGAALRTLAIAELEAGNLDRAEELVSEAEKHGGGGVYQSNFILGEADFRRGNWKEAVEHFNLALAGEPPSIASRTSLMMELARAYRKLGENARAAATLRQAIEWDPENRSLRGFLLQIETKPNDAPSTPPAGARTDI